jgi:hypothetical protein
MPLGVFLRAKIGIFGKGGKELSETEKLGALTRIKHRFARGLVSAAISYVVYMIILLATNRTQFTADVFLLWMLMPVLYLSIVAAINSEITWSFAAYVTRRALLEKTNREEGGT